MPGESPIQHFDTTIYLPRRCFLLSARSGFHYYLDIAPGNDIRLHRT